MNESKRIDSAYDDKGAMALNVEQGQHRELVGGLWEEIGQLQLEFLVRQGLLPKHHLLDIGCGSLRAGVKLIPYLEPGNYWGVDNNTALLDAGWERELAPLDLQVRQPRDQLVTLADFQFAELGQTFDVALAQSVFTHFSWNRIRRCLARLAPVMKPGGRLFATFFELPDGADTQAAIRHEPGGIATHGDRDPYHYGLSDLEQAARGMPWRVQYVGEWGHPRDQRMLVFIREASIGDAPKTIRAFSTAEAAGLTPGDRHYRAFIGPPDRFDFMSATQFSLLFALGLRENHRVLDFGCGSLRLGRLLIPFLQEGRYFGIEPETWLIEDALDRELGRDVLRIKHPAFSPDNGFDCRVFRETFEFIVAQSILTHTGPDLVRRFLASAAESLAAEGLLVFSYSRSDDPRATLPGDGWHYPQCVGYTEIQMLSLLAEAGIHGRAIPWYHPGARWIAASRNSARLPKPSQLLLLRGAVLNQPQFEDSLTLSD